MNRLPDARDGAAPEEFRHFIDLLLEGAPDGYKPWLFRCGKESKAPATEYGSWKDKSNRLSVEEALSWMEEGGNVGIAGMEGDRLVNVDIDDVDETDPEDLKPTLRSRSRSRSGRHVQYFEEPGEEVPNIPTDDKGEVRARGQYVLAPGSYVPTDPEEVPDGQEDVAGYYTVEVAKKPASITVEELPDVFQRVLRQAERREHDAPDIEVDIDVPEGDGKSALFDVRAEDVVRKEGGETDPSERWSSAFHISKTDENTSLSNKGRIQCWRHNVAHGGLQALVVLSDYPKGCKAVGTPHKESKAGPSCIKGDDSAIWYAWKYAKQNGYIPADDPVPYRALKHICRKRELCPVTELPDGYDPENGETIPSDAYDSAVSLIRDEFDLDPGRELTKELDQQASTDGGTAAKQPQDGGPDIGESTDGDSPPTGNELKATLGYDVDDSLRDIPKHELANGIETMLAERDNVHIRLLDNDDSKDQPIYAMDEKTKVWENKGARRLAQKARRILGPVYRNGIQSELENALRSNIDGHWLLDRDELGVEVGYLPVKNRVLDLETRGSRDADPEDYLLGRLPTPYDPEATIDGTRFEEFLLQCVKPQDRDKLQEYAGYTLLKNAQPYKKALFLVGPQNSGKGTFLKTLEMILGEDNVASETLYNLVNTRWGTHSIYRRMVNTSNEVSPSGLGNVGQFKMLTGGEDKVPAEDKGVSKYRFTVTQKFIFATNEFPEVEDAGEPFYSRLLFVEFPNSIPDEKQDPSLRDDLREERSAILNWMLDGLDRLRENGTFSDERTIEDKKELTKAFGSTIEQFAHNALEATNDSDHVIHKKELYAAFIRYCDFMNADTPTQTKFTRQLKEEDGITDGKSTRVDGDKNRPGVFKGAKLNEEFFKKIQADLPDHSYETDSGGQTGMDSYSE